MEKNKRIHKQTQKTNKNTHENEERKDKKDYWLDYILDGLRKNIEKTNKTGLTEYLKKNKSAVIVIFSAIAIPYLKAIFYAFQRGRFSVYDISENYISVGDNVIQEGILYLGAVVVIIFFITLNLAITPRKGRIWENVRNHIILYVIQYACMVLFAYPEVTNLVKYFKSKEVRSFLTWVLVAIVMLNLLPFFVKVYCRLAMEDKDDKKDELSNFDLNKKIGLAAGVLFFMALTVVFSYCWGRSDEGNKTMYKCVREEVDEALQEEDDNESNVVKDEENAEEETDEEVKGEFADNICADGYVYYAIVDEQPNRYIVCILDVKTTDGNEKYIINTARKKIIQNTGVEVFNKEVCKARSK